MSWTRVHWKVAKLPGQHQRKTRQLQKCLSHTKTQCQNKCFTQKVNVKIKHLKRANQIENVSRRNINALWIFVLKTQSQPRTLLGQSEIYSRNSRNYYFDCCLYYYFIGVEKAWLCLMRRQVGNTSWHCQPRKTHKHHTPGKFSPWKGKTRNLSTNCFPHISLQVFASNHWQRRTSWCSVMVVYCLRISQLDNNGHSMRILLVIPYNDAASE